MVAQIGESHAGDQEWQPWTRSVPIAVCDPAVQELRDNIWTKLKG
jgi:hypothetical protein